MHVIELRIGKTRHRGLLGGSVTLGLEQIAHPFTIRYVERTDDSGKPWYLECGDFVEVLVGQKLLVDGFVDSTRMRHTAESFDVEASGRARPLDLVDCVHVSRPRQFSNATVDTIVAAIAKPFGFDVDLGGESPGQAIRRFKIGEDTAFAAISRVCRLRGFWPRYEPGSNTIKLSRIDATPSSKALVVGENVLELERTTDWSQRFSSYHFTGSTHATDDVFGPATRLRSVVSDRAVDRYRPTRIEAHGADGPDDVGQRAILERNQRAGSAEVVRATVAGWFDGDGELYKPNTLYPVTSKRLGLDRTSLLVVSATYEFEAASSEGYVTKLELKRPEALDHQATYPTSERRRIWK